MKFGICIDWKKEENLLAAKAAGADYVELNFQSFLPETKETITTLANKLQVLNLDMVAYNCMLPKTIRVTGEKKDFAAARDYLSAQLEKLQILPARIVIFGSDSARRLDGDNTKENGMRELTVFLQDYLAPVFEEYGFICVIEPLSECNFIRTLADGLALVKAVDRPCVRLLADFYHIAVCHEPLDHYAVYQPYLYHTHIAAKNGRTYPKATDPDDYSAIFRALREAGYDQRISLEARATPGCDQETEWREALNCLRKAYINQ